MKSVKLARHHTLGEVYFKVFPKPSQKNYFKFNNFFLLLSRESWLSTHCFSNKFSFTIPTINSHLSHDCIMVYPLWYEYWCDIPRLEACLRRVIHHNRHLVASNYIIAIIIWCNFNTLESMKWLENTTDT